jgi:hypothetical protein
MLKIEAGEKLASGTECAVLRKGQWTRFNKPAPVRVIISAGQEHSLSLFHSGVFIIRG